VQKAFAALPFTQKAVRLTGTSILELLMVGGVLEYKNMSFVGKIAERACKAHLRRQVRDPEVRRKLTPDYTSAASARRSPTRTSRRSTRSTCTSRPRRSRRSMPTGS
jgi:cation diffusion facilitator CzcD-associated flavoprotein CzcO